MNRAIATILSALLFAFPAVADTHHRMDTRTEGEVRKVDKDARKITIKHGPIQHLDMPAMTMVFQIKEPAMLEQVIAGDKVKFEAQKVNGAFTVIAIEKVK